MRMLFAIILIFAARAFCAQKDSIIVVKEPTQLVKTFDCPGALNKQYILKGIIYDANSKEELPYATVFIKGTKVGTQSDVKGLFELDLTSLIDSTRTLTIIGSYVGYTIKEIEINDNWTLGTYLSIAMVSNSGISHPEIVIPEKKSSGEKMQRTR